MKKIIILSISMLTMIMGLTGCGKKKETEEKTDIKVNTNNEVIKDQEIDEIKITNTSMVTTNGVTKLVTNVTNNGKEDYKLDKFIIIIKDKEGKEIVRIPGYVGDTIKVGETRTINSSIDMDLSNAGSIEYEVKK